MSPPKVNEDDILFSYCHTLQYVQCLLCSINQWIKWQVFSGTWESCLMDRDSWITSGITCGADMGVLKDTGIDPIITFSGLNTEEFPCQSIRSLLIETPISPTVLNSVACFSVKILSYIWCVLNQNVTQTCRGFHHPVSEMSVVIGSARAIILIRMRMFLEHHLVKAKLHISRLSL